MEKRPVFEVHFVPKVQHAPAASANPRRWLVTCRGQDPSIHETVLQAAFRQFAKRHGVPHWEDVAIRYDVKALV